MDEGALQELLTGENWFVLAGLAGALLIAAIAVWRRVRRPERRRAVTAPTSDSRLEAFGEAMQAYGLPADSVRVSVVDAADVEFVTPEEELAELMLERRYAYNNIKSRLGQRQGDEPDVMALREEAEALVDAGRLADAEEAFETAFERQIAAVPSSEQLRASAAWDKAAQARVVFLGGDLLRSAELFGHAAETAPASDEFGRWAYRLSQAQSLREHGVNDELEAAAAAFRAVLKERNREPCPPDWSGAQVYAAGGLLKLGALGDGDRAVLTKAIAAFRAALEVITPESDPTSWVFVRYNMTAAELLEFKATGDRSHLERARDALADVAEVSMDELLLNYRQLALERLAEIERLLGGEATT